LAVGVLVAVPTAADTLSQHTNHTHAASPLGPPVITEDFKPIIPCNRNTTAGQEGCGEHEVLAADKYLNADVKIILGLLDKATYRAFVTHKRPEPPIEMRTAPPSRYLSKRDRTARRIRLVAWTRTTVLGERT
jgi:hypothetical protein